MCCAGCVAGETEPMEYNLEVEDEDWLRKHRL